MGVAALFAAATIAGCGGGDSAGSSSATAAGTGSKASGDSVKVGLITAVSGPAGVYSPSIKQAVELAVGEVNKDGGVNGKQLEVVVADDGTNPQKSEQEARRLVDEGVKMVVSQQTSATRPPASSVIERAKIPFIFSWSYEGGECGPYQWFTGQIPNQWVDPAIKELVGKEGKKRWYLLGNDYLWGREMNKRIGEQVKANGGEVIGEAYVPFGTTEFQSTVSKVRDAGDDAMIVTNLVGADLIGFMKQYRAAGGKQQLIGWAVDEQTLEAMGPGVGKGVLGPFDYYVTLDTPENKSWLDRLKAKYGDKMALPGSLTVQGYDAIKLWAMAANKAGSTDSDAVSKALPTVKLTDGPRGEVRFTEDHYMAMRNYIAKVDDSGTRFGDIKDLGVIQPQSGCSPGDVKG
jgi:ABC-type branched-subunit amino acid transport system substrate-binding protein